MAFFQSLVVLSALYALSCEFSFRLSVTPWLGLATGLSVLGVSGFISFWIVYFLPHSSHSLEVIFGTVAVILLGRTAFRRNAADIELLVPCALAGAASVGLILWGFGGHADLRGGDILRFAGARWTHQLPGDNEIPYVFATALRQHTLGRGLFYGDWLSSDRPSLQTGLYLLLNLRSFNDYFGYQALATALQMFSLIGVWLMARALGTSTIWAYAAMAAAFFTPLVLINGLFVWPKLLAVAFLFVTTAVQIAANSFRLERPILAGGLVGSSAALAMLSHPGSVFILIGMAIITLFTKFWREQRYLVVAATCCLALYAPWIIYQNFIDPPGNFLLKMHLAGVMTVEDHSLGQDIREAYSKTTWREIFATRVYNAEEIVESPITPIRLFLSGRMDIREFRIATFFHAPLGMGLLCLALFASPILLVYRNIRTLIAIIWVSLVVWVLVMFVPGAAIPHAGSYFPQFALITIMISTFAKRAYTRSVTAVVILLQVLTTGAVFAF